MPALSPAPWLHVAEVRRVLRRAGIASADLDDAAQEVMARSYRRVLRRPGDTGVELLRETARRVAGEYLGREADGDGEVLAPAPRAAAPWLAELASEARIEIDVEARHALAQAIGALSVLPRLERSLYVGAHWQGKSRAELASEFGLRPGTVATRLARGDQLLRCALHKLERQDGESRLANGTLPAWAAPGRRQPGVNVMARREGFASHGGWMLINNQWARARVQEPFDQCLLFRRGGGGWSWSWPRSSPLPVAFPQAIYGRSPWRPWIATDARFPLPLERLGSVILDFDVQTHALGSYSLLLVMYLVGAHVTAAELTPASIVTELTLVLDHRGHAAPEGAIVDRLLVDGVRYDLRREYGAGAPELLGYLGFYLQPSVPRRAGRLNLSNLLAQLVRRRHVEVPLALASIELGNEVIGGGGTTWLERLALHVGSS